MEGEGAGRGEGKGEQRIVRCKGERENMIERRVGVTEKGWKRGEKNWEKGERDRENCARGTAEKHGSCHGNL